MTIFASARTGAITLGKVAGGFRLRDVDDILRHSRHCAATERPNLTACAAKSCEE